MVRKALLQERFRNHFYRNQTLRLMKMEHEYYHPLNFLALVVNGKGPLACLHLLKVMGELVVAVEVLRPQILIFEDLVWSVVDAEWHFRSSILLTVH